MFRYVHILLFIGLQLAMPPLVGACSRSVQESRHTLAVADSLRVHEGRLYDDSMAIADAYATFGSRRLIYPDDYARACYYYGRLLRNRGNQVAAMQAFIAGTHAPYIDRIVPLPWFNDYHILGRIYSNMGTMCHLAGEYELSYEMYENAADVLLHINDSVNYYYAIYNMAFETAEQADAQHTHRLLDHIYDGCTDSTLLSLTLFVSAELYLKISKYDSMLYYAKQLEQSQIRYKESIFFIAQAYDKLGNKDSALLYANKVLTLSNIPNECFNALYIVINNNSTLSDDSIRKLSSQREDIRYHAMEPQKNGYLLSVQYLKGELNKLFPWEIYLTTLIISIAIISLIISLKRLNQIHIQRKSIEQESVILQKELKLVQKQQAEYLALETSKIEKTCVDFMSSGDLRHKLHVRNNDTMKKVVDKHFGMLATKLEQTFQLKEHEILFCTLVLLNAPRQQMAPLLSYSHSSIPKLKSIIAKKIGTTSRDLRNQLISIVLQH